MDTTTVDLAPRGSILWCQRDAEADRIIGANPAAEQAYQRAADTLADLAGTGQDSYALALAFLYLAHATKAAGEGDDPTPAERWQVTDPERTTPGTSYLARQGWDDYSWQQATS